MLQREFDDRASAPEGFTALESLIDDLNSNTPFETTDPSKGQPRVVAIDATLNLVKKKLETLPGMRDLAESSGRAYAILGDCYHALSSSLTVINYIGEGVEFEDGTRFRWSKAGSKEVPHKARTLRMVDEVLGYLERVREVPEWRNWYGSRTPIGRR